MKRKHTYHSAETKIRAVQMFIKEKKSQKEIADHFGVAVQRVKDWVWIYRRKGELGFLSQRGRPKRINDSQAEIARLKMENELLKKFHTELRKATLAKRNIG
jgi:transposase-like protein